MANGCGYQEVGVASGWNLCVVIRRWVWLKCICVVSGCCCIYKDVYRFPHITYPYSTCISSSLQQDPNFFKLKHVGS